MRKRESISHSSPGEFLPPKANIVAFPKITILPMDLCLFTLGQRHKELGYQPGTLRLECPWSRATILLAGQTFREGAETLREEEGSRSRNSEQVQWKHQVPKALAWILAWAVGLVSGGLAGPTVGPLAPHRRRLCCQGAIFLGSSRHLETIF